MKTPEYYFADDCFSDMIHGDQIPICLDRAEVNRLAGEWGHDVDEFLSCFHIATSEEIRTYGTYDSNN